MLTDRKPEDARDAVKRDDRNNTGSEIEFSNPVKFLSTVSFSELPETPVLTSQAGATTISVLNVERVRLMNTGSVTVTNLTNGQEGQSVIFLGDGFTTFANNSNIATNTAANKLLAAGATYTFTRIANKWIESAASASTPSWTRVFQASDLTVNNTTTYQNSSLAFAVAANTKYHFHGIAFIDTGATADAKFQFTGPAAPTILRIRTASINAAATAFGNIRVEVAFSQSRALAGTGTNGAYVEFHGILHNGANAGTVTFQWGANALEAVNTILRAGSYLEWSAVS